MRYANYFWLAVASRWVNSPLHVHTTVFVLWLGLLLSLFPPSLPSFQALETLLKEKLIPVTQVFSPGHVTLAHLACALCLHEMVRMVSRVGGNGSSSGNEIWSVKDEEGGCGS